MNLLSNKSGILQEYIDKFTNLRLEVINKLENQKGFEVLPWRWIVERTFAWLGKLVMAFSC